MKRRKQNLNNALCMVVVYVLCFAIHAPRVNAQQVDLSVSPALLDVVMQPGKIFSTTLSLHNNGDDVIISPSVRSSKYIASQDSLKPLSSLNGRIALRLSSKENASESAILIKKNQTKDFRLTIQVPEQIDDSEQYYSALFETKNPMNKTGVTAQINTIIGTNIILTVSNNGIVQIKGKLASMKTDLQARSFPAKLLNIFDSTDAVPITLTVVNQGRNKIRPTGNLTIRGSFGETATYPIDPQNVLAYSSRNIKIKPLSGFFVGHYSLSAEVDLGESGPKLFASTSFFAFPVRYFIVFVVIALVGWWIIRKSEK